MADNRQNLLNEISDGLRGIRAAINSSNVTIPEDTPLQDYKNYIEKISQTHVDIGKQIFVFYTWAKTVDEALKYDKPSIHWNTETNDGWTVQETNDWQLDIPDNSNVSGSDPDATYYTFAMFVSLSIGNSTGDGFDWPTPVQISGSKGEQGEKGDKGKDGWVAGLILNTNINLYSLSPDIVESNLTYDVAAYENSSTYELLDTFLMYNNRPIKAWSNDSQDILFLSCPKTNDPIYTLTVKVSSSTPIVKIIYGPTCQSISDVIIKYSNGDDEWTNAASISKENPNLYAKVKTKFGTEERETGPLLIAKYPNEIENFSIIAYGTSWSTDKEPETWQNTMPDMNEEGRPSVLWGKYRVEHVDSNKNREINTPILHRGTAGIPYNLIMTFEEELNIDNDSNKPLLWIRENWEKLSVIHNAIKAGTGVYMYVGSNVNETSSSYVCVGTNQYLLKLGTFGGSGTQTVKITYDELRELKTKSKLVPGIQYRIIDYQASIIQENVRSAGHLFDLIVTADSVNTINHKAKAIQSSRDTEGYFANSDLSAWEIWYDFDNKRGCRWSPMKPTQSVLHINGESHVITDNIIEIEACDSWLETDIPMLTPTSLYDTNSDWFIGKDDNRIYRIFDTITAVAKEPDNITFNDILHQFNIERATIDDSDRILFIDSDENTSMYLKNTNEADTIVISKNMSEVQSSYTTFMSPLMYNEGNQSGWFISTNDYITMLEYCNGNNNEISIDELSKLDIHIYHVVDVVDYNVAVPLYKNDTEYEVPTIIEESINFKGVIYRMIDEHNNDCPYDFKNIQFNRSANDIAPENWYYTFNLYYENSNEVYDLSHIGNECYNNTIKWRSSDTLLDNVFINTSSYASPCHDNTFGDYCCGNTFGNGCHDNTFGDYCEYNTFSMWVSNNRFGNYFRSSKFYQSCQGNTFGDICANIQFGYNCSHNTFGYGCRNMEFNINCQHNTFGDYCYKIKFGESCNYNTFGDECEYNTFGNNCYRNTFGDSCDNNTFGHNCYRNTFEPTCSGNSFRAGNSLSTTLLNECHNNHFDIGCSNLLIINTKDPGNGIRNIHVVKGVVGESKTSPKSIHISSSSDDFEVTVASDSRKIVRVYCEADLPN